MVTKVLEKFAEQSSVKCEFRPAFNKYIKKIKVQVFWYKIESRMKQICENPYIGDRKKGPLKDAYCYKFYYVRVQHMITYKNIEGWNKNQKGIEFFMIDDHGDDYKSIVRYVKTSK